MTPRMRTLGKILKYLALAAALLGFVMFVLLQTSYVQTRLTDYATDKLKEMFDADINVGRLSFKPFTTLVIKDLTIVDTQPKFEQARDTLLHVDKMDAQFSLLSLFSPTHQDVIFRRVKVNGGRFNLVVEGDKYLPTNLSRMFHLRRDKIRKAPKPKDIFAINHIELQNFTYAMQNFKERKSGKAPREHGDNVIDWRDMEATDIKASADNFRMSHGRFYGDLVHLEATETRTGWRITHMSGSTASGQADARIYDLHVEDNHSSCMNLDFQMLGRTRDFLEFADKVVLRASIRDSHLSLKTLSHFVEAFNPDEKIFFNFHGGFDGRISNFNLEDLDLSVENTKLRTRMSGNISGLPGFANARVNLVMKETRFTTVDLTRFLHGALPAASKVDLTGFGSGKTYYAAMSARGHVNDLAVNASLKQGSTYGKAELKGRLQNLLSEAPLGGSGHIYTSAFNLGTLFQSSKMGPLSIKSDFILSAPGHHIKPVISVTDLEISGMELNGYSYSGITGYARYKDGHLGIDLHSADENFDADVKAWTEDEAYCADINIRKADFKEMNLDKREKSEVAGDIHIRTNKDFDNISGEASLDNIRLTSSEGTQVISDIDISLAKAEDLYEINAVSDDFEAAFTGNRKQAKASFRTFNTTSILAYLLPGAYIDNGTSIDLDMSPQGDIQGHLNSHRIAWKENYIKDIACTLEGTLENFTASIHADEIKALGVTSTENMLGVLFKDKTARADYSFHKDAEKLSEGTVSVEARFPAKGEVELDILPTTLCIRGEKWDIRRAHAGKKGYDFVIDGFKVSNKDQSISLDGAISKERKESLTARMKNIDLSILNAVMKKFDLNIGGSLDAFAQVESPLRDGMPKVQFSIDGKGLSVGGEDLGRLTAACDYNKELEHYYISANQRIGGHQKMGANAILYPKDRSLNAEINMDKYPIGFAQAFIPNVVKQLRGELSGVFMLDGPLGEINISSRDARIDNGMTRVAFTNVIYDLSGKLNADNEGIHLSKAVATDRYGTRALLNGGIKWDRGRNMALDFGMDFQNLEFLDIPANAPSKLFYGHIFSSGSLHFDGPMGDITLTLGIQSTGNSQIHILTPKSMEATKSNLLTFVDSRQMEVDPYEQMLNNLMEKRRRKTDFTVRMHAIVDPSLAVILDLGNNRLSSGVEVYGNGILDVEYFKNSKDYSMLGDYTMTEGKVDVNISNLVRRVFHVQNGSTIRFQGKIPDSNINLSATYDTKASLSTLLAETDGDGARRQVYCGINVANNIKNPQIKFNIDIPDLNPSFKTSVENALGTEDKVQKQFLSLLLSNSFLPDEQGGIVNNSSMLLSNASEIMANQVNNIFNKLDIPLDLGLKYRPTENGVNLFDVAISTQLFNNRVIIGGNFGNKQSLTTSNGTFFGDVDVQYKVLRSGSLRLKAFSHSADKYSNFLDNGQRNGVGVSWQQEFDTFPEWFKRMFSSRAKKEALKQMEAMNIKRQNTIILDE